MAKYSKITLYVLILVFFTVNAGLIGYYFGYLSQTQNYLYQKTLKQEQELNTTVLDETINEETEETDEELPPQPQQIFAVSGQILTVTDQLIILKDKNLKIFIDEQTELAKNFQTGDFVTIQAGENIIDKLEFTATKITLNNPIEEIN